MFMHLLADVVQNDIGVLHAGEVAVFMHLLADVVQMT